MATPVRKPRAPTFSYAARKVLQRAWAASGGQCGKYLAVSMRVRRDALEFHGELADLIADGRLRERAKAVVAR